jgi:hypothetical protein
MIKQLEGLRDNMTLIKTGITESLIQTLPYEHEKFSRSLEDAVYVGMVAYTKVINQLPIYQYYLRRWSRVIPGTSFYKSRTSDFISASIKLIKDKNYRFDDRSLFDTTGSNSKFFRL